ncbi:MAG: phosphonate metabolism protein/1,5-bisphosphokinase (PRPP-forming) PhnN [Hyphomicrobiaceae bacterium]
MTPQPSLDELSGLLVLVVGASGTGKDTLLREIERSRGSSISVIRRFITRPVEPSEPHIPVTAEEFEAMERTGDFSLSWRAHGMCYGIGCEVNMRLALGDTCIASVSRTAIADARRNFPKTLVVEVTVPDSVREKRLLARGREELADIQQRLQRKIEASTDARADIVLDNSGPIEVAVETLLKVLGLCALGRRDKSA